MRLNKRLSAPEGDHHAMAWSMLDPLEDACIEIAAALTQKNPKLVRSAAGAGAATASGFAAQASVFAAVGAFGTASTGTAIASLSGAAANSATLFAVGSTLGLGAVGGGIILLIGGVAVGLVGKRRVARLWGAPLERESLPPADLEALAAAESLLDGIRLQRQVGVAPKPADLRLTADLAAGPLARRLDDCLRANRRPLIRRWALRGAQGKLNDFNRKYGR